MLKLLSVLFIQSAVFLFSFLSTTSFADNTKLVIQDGHRNTIVDLIYSLDGKYLASISQDKIIKIWDISSGKLLNTIIDPDIPTSFWFDNTDILFSKDNQGLIVKDENIIKLWSIDTGNLLKSQKLSNNFDSIFFNPNGTLFGTAPLKKDSHEGIGIWDIESGSVAFRSNSYFNYIRSFFSSSGNHLVIIDNSKVTVTDMKQPNKSFVIESDEVLFDTMSQYKIDVSPNGDYLLVTRKSLQNSSVEFWNFRGEKLKHFENASCGTFSPDGIYFSISDSKDNSIKHHEISSGNEVGIITNKSKSIDNLSYSQDGRLLSFFNVDNLSYDIYDRFLSLNKQNIKIWDIQSGRPLTTINTNSESIVDTSFSPDNKNIASREINSQNVKIWDVQSGTLIKEIKVGTFYSIDCNGNCGEPPYINYSPDGKSLVANSMESVKILDIESGKVTKSLSFIDKDCGALGGGNYGKVRYSPNGKYISAYFCGRQQIWNVETGKLVRNFASSGKHSTFSANSTQFLTTDEKDPFYLINKNVSNKIRIWDISSGKIVRTIFDSPKYISNISFSPKGKYIMAIGSNTQKIWDAENGKNIATFIGVNSGIFNRNENLITNSNYNGEIKFISLSDFKEIISITPIDKNDWITLDFSNQYDLSENGKQYIHWVNSREILNFNDFSERLYSKNLFLKVMEDYK